MKFQFEKLKGHMRNEDFRGTYRGGQGEGNGVQTNDTVDQKAAVEPATRDSKAGSIFLQSHFLGLNRSTFPVTSL